MTDHYKSKPFTCNACDWRDVGRGYAAPSGPPDAPIRVVAESAGENEARQGQPLVGWTGQQVNKALEACGIKRADVRCDNIVRCMPPPSPGRQKKIPKHIIDYCTKHHLQQDLDAHPPKVIIALGDYSLHYLTGRHGITKNRGSIIPHANGVTSVIPTIHYAAIAHGASEKRSALNVLRPYIDYDFKKAVEVAQNGPQRVIRNYNWRPSLADIRTRLSYIATKKLPCAVDIETAGGQWWDTSVLCIGIYCEDWAICVPFLGFRGEKEWREEEWDELLELLGDVLCDPEIEKTFQNGNSDVMVLESIGF